MAVNRVCPLLGGCATDSAIDQDRSQPFYVHQAGLDPLQLANGPACQKYGNAVQWLR